jgi:2-isopropylmalate synthase
MSVDDKVVIAKLLEKIGVFETNVGYASYIKDHAEVARRLKRECPKLRTSCFIRAWRAKDIREDTKREVDLALELGVSQVTILIPSGNWHLKIHKISQGKLLDNSVAAVEVAKSCGASSITYAPYDTTRTDLNFLKTLYTCTIQAGANRVLAYDTLGVMNPHATFFWMSEIRKAINVPIQFHCHNDFGLAVANTIAAVVAGAEYIDIVVNGLGDRAGNCSFEEAVMGLEGLYHIDTGIKTEGLYELCKKVEEISGVKIPANKAVCGKNAFIHESDGHVHGILSGNTPAYEPYEPSLIGRKREIYFGSTTSVDSVEMKAEKMGIKVSSDQMQAVMAKIKGKIDEKGFATEEEVESFIKKLR